MSKKTKGIFLSLGGILVVLVVVLIVVESCNQNKIVIENEMGEDVTSLVVEFYNMETETDYGEVYHGNVPDGETVTKSFETLDFGGSYAECFITVQLADGQIYQEIDGLFEKKFPGKIKLRFYKTDDGERALDSYAGIGLFGSTETTGMDSTIYLYDETDDEED